MSFTDRLRSAVIRVLRWSEKYTGTDMVYLAGAGFWSNLNFGVTSILALLLSIAFANLLPQAEYGVYQYLIALSGIVVAITLAGMNNAVAQSVSRGYEGDLKASVRVQLLWSIVPTVLTLGGALYYFAHGNGATAAGLVIIALLSPLTNAFNTYQAFLNGKREFKRMFMYALLINAAYYPVMFVVMLFVKDAVWLVFVNLATNAGAIAYIYFRTLKVYKPNGQTDPATIPYGKHLSVMNAFGTIITQLDSVLVFHFLGAVDLAVYSFASMLPERVAGLFNFVSTAALPKFSNQSAENIRAHIVGKTLRAAGAGAVATVIYAAIAPFLFHLLFPKYLVALPYTEAYALVIITLAANLPATALVAQHRQRELYIYNIVNPLVLLGLQVPMLIFFGLLGILMARVVANVFNILLALWLVLYPLRERPAQKGA